MKSSTDWGWTRSVLIIVLTLIASTYIAGVGTVQRFFETQSTAASDLAAALGDDAEILGLGDIRARDIAGEK